MKKLELSTCEKCQGRHATAIHEKVVEMQRMVKENRVEFASTAMIDTFSDNVEKLIGDYLGIKRFFVSDMSSIGDFCDEEDLPQLSENLGFKVERQHLIWEVAASMQKSTT